MARNLTPNEVAYNACVQAKKEATERLTEALADYNSAAAACETLFKLNLHKTKRLVDAR